MANQKKKIEFGTILFQKIGSIVIKIVFFFFWYLDEILHQKNSEAYQKQITPLLMILIKFWIFFLKWELQDDNNDMNMHPCMSLKIAYTGTS